MDDFRNIQEMAKTYKNSSFADSKKLLKLDKLGFICLIYSLYTGKFEITGFSDKSFLRYFLTSGTSESKNLPLNIANNLPYSKSEFIKIGRAHV